MTLAAHPGEFALWRMRISPGLGFLSSLALLATTVPAGADEAAVATRRIQAHVTFLADDLLEGRGTGKRGHELAARYVATQFAVSGSSPGPTVAMPNRSGSSKPPATARPAA